MRKINFSVSKRGGPSPAASSGGAADEAAPSPSMFRRLSSSLRSELT